MIDLWEPNILTFRAEESLDNKTGYLVAQGAAQNGVILPAGDGNICLGVLKFEAANGAACSVVTAPGHTECVASEAIAIGDPLSAKAGGKVQVAAVGEYVVGFAMSAATLDGDAVLVRIVEPQLKLQA